MVNRDFDPGPCDVVCLASRHPCKGDKVTFWANDMRLAVKQ